NQLKEEANKEIKKKKEQVEAEIELNRNNQENEEQKIAAQEAAAWKYELDMLAGKYYSVDTINEEVEKRLNDIELGSAEIWIRNQRKGFDPKAKDQKELRKRAKYIIA